MGWDNGEILDYPTLYGPPGWVQRPVGFVSLVADVNRLASCARERTPSLAYARDKWASTVLTVTCKVRAISLFALVLLSMLVA